MGKCSSNIYLPELNFLFLLFILAQVLHSNQVRTWTGPAERVWACSVRGSSVWPNVNWSPVQCSQILGKNLTEPNFGTTNMNAFGLISELRVSAFHLLLLWCGLQPVTTCSMQVRWLDLLRWWIQLLQLMTWKQRLYATQLCSHYRQGLLSLGRWVFRS